MKISLCLRAALLLILTTCVAHAASAQPPVPVNGPSPNFGTHSVGEVQISLAATSGDGTYTWTLVSGAMPPGLSLRTDGPGWFPPNASAGIIGIATTPGTYIFTVRVTSGGQSADQTCTVTITALDFADHWELPHAFENKAYSFNLSAVNNAGPVTFTSTGGGFNGVPPGMTLTPGGLLSGTPTAIASGFYNIWVHLTDTVHTVSRNVSLSVHDIEITTPGELGNVTFNTPYSVTFQATGGTGLKKFTSSGLPAGLVLDQDTGVMSGISGGRNGLRGFSLTATDENHVSYTKQMSIVGVAEPVNLPSVTVGGLTDCSLGVPCSRTANVGSGGRAPFTWMVSGLPPGMIARTGSGVTSWFVAPGNLEIVGSPAALGDFPLQITVTDADGQSASNTFTLRVAPMWRENDPPFGTIDVPYPFYKQRIIGGTLPYTAVQTGGQLAAGLAYEPSTFVVSGTPQENGFFNASFQFTDSANPNNVYNFGNGFSIGGGTSTINIDTGPNLGTILTGSNFSRQFFACCVPSFTWSHVGGTIPTGLTLSLNGLLSGVPTVEGTYTFMVRAQDATFAANFGQRQFTLIVTPVNNPTPPLPFGNVDSFYSATITATGGTGPYTFTLGPFSSLPPGVTLDANGTVSGTPTAGGQFNFNVVTTDSAGRIHTRGFGIAIYPAGVNPPLNLTIPSNLGTFLRGFVSIQLTTTGGAPPYTYSLPPGATVIPGMRVQTGQPLPTFFQPGVTGGYLGVMTTSGVFSTTIRVTDSLEATFDRAVTFTVSPLHLLSQTNSLPKALVGTPYFFELTPFGGSGTYSWALTQAPSWLSINGFGQLSGTPTAAGLAFPRVTLTDLVAQSSVSFGLTVVVNAFDITPGGVLPQGTVGIPYSQTFMADCGGACTWTAFDQVPANLSLNPSTGELSGTPSRAGHISFTMVATGPNGSVQEMFSLLVVNSQLQALSITRTSPLGDITFSNNAGYTLSAQGGTPPYIWSLHAGTLPNGITLQSPGEQISSNFGPGFTLLAGRAMELGTFTFTLKVTDAALTSATRAFTLRVSPIGFHYFGLPIPGNPLVYNTPYTQALLAVGGTVQSTGNYAWAANLPMPPELALDAATGIVSGTPTNTGNFNRPIQATDDAGDLFIGNINFTIAGPTPTAIFFGVGPNLGVVQQGFSFSRTLNLSSGTPPYTVTALSALPTGCALQSGDSLLFGTAEGSHVLACTPLASGPFSVTLQAQDSAGNIGVRTLFWTVLPFNLFTSTSLADGSVSVPYSESLIVFPPTAIWTVSQDSAMPPGLTVSPAGVISGTPTQAGTHSFTLTAMDTTSGFATGIGFSLRVSGIAITDASSILPIATAGVPFTHTFTATGGAGTLIWSATGLPFGFTLSPSGTLSGTAAGFVAAQVIVRVTDGIVPVSRRFSLFARLPLPNQLNFGLAATVIPDVTVGQSMSFGLNPNNGVAPYTWTVAAGSTLPAGLLLLSGSALPHNAQPGTTLLAGAPTTAGFYTFDLIATDSALPTPASIRRTFTLRVSAISILPGQPRTATIGTAYVQRFMPAGGTPPYTFSISPVGLTQEMLPPGITFTPDGLFSGTPTSTGNYTFTLKLQDGANNTFSRTYTIQVNRIQGNGFLLRVTSQNPNDTWVGSGRRFQNLTTNGPSTYTWSFVSGTMPAGMALVSGAEVIGAGTTLLAGQPTTPGTYVYVLRATDTANALNYADHQFTLRVSPMQLVTPPVALTGVALIELPSGQVGVALTPFTLKVAGGTPPYTFVQSSFAPLPPGVTLSTAGVLSGVPQQAGVFVVAPIVTDAAMRTVNSAGVNLIVTAAGVSPQLVPTSVLRLRLPDASVGVPHQHPLDVALLRGGVAPFAWSVTAGSLPPGMDLMLGDGVPNYLGGVPSAAGIYELSLTATDAVLQSVTIPITIAVTTLALTPESIAPGVVGTTLNPSVTLTPSGGIGPFTIVALPTWDVPGGMTLSPSGLLSGTPTHPGNFLLNVRVTDSIGNSFTKFYRTTIDNATGEAQAVKLAPKPVQVYYQQGSPAPAPVAISVQTTSGSVPFTLDLSNIPGATLSASAGTAPATVNLNLNVSGLATGTYVGLVGVKATQSANQLDVTPVTLTVAPAPPCTYSVNPAEGSVPSVGGSGTFSVATPSHCAWTASVSAPSWISITSGASGTGAADVTYSVSINASPDARSGTITVNGAVYTITQFGGGCSFTISPVNLAATSAGGPAQITVTASNSVCLWTASGLGATPASGSGSGTVTVTIPANGTAATLVHTATIADKTLTVNQTGINCTVGLSPYEANAPATPPVDWSGAVAVTTPPGCPYSTVPGPSWIQVTSGGSGTSSGTLVYSVDGNSTTVARSGTLMIGGQPFQLTQDGLACSVTVNTSGLGSPYGSTGGTGTIGITTNGANCSWTASSDSSWATVVPIGSTGNGSIGVSASSNASSTTGRSAQLTVGGQTITISQAGTTCTYALQSTSGAVPASGGSGSVGVIAPAVCGWTAATTAPTWLTITSSGNAGTSSVQFSVQSNLSASPRTGNLTIAGLIYEVTQAGAPCTYTLSSTSTTVGPEGLGTPGAFTFSALAGGCTPLAVSYANWISVTTVFAGTSGTIEFTVLENPSASTRVGTIQVGDKTFTVTQLGGQCGYSLNAYGIVFGQAGGGGNVLGSPSALGCTPATGTNQPSFILLDLLTGPVNNIFTQPYSVTPFNSLTNAIRLGNITFGGQIFTIKQTSW